MTSSSRAASGSGGEASFGSGPMTPLKSLDLPHRPWASMRLPSVGPPHPGLAAAAGTLGKGKMNFDQILCILSGSRSRIRSLS